MTDPKSALRLTGRFARTATTVACCVLQAECASRGAVTRSVSEGSSAPASSGRTCGGSGVLRWAAGEQGTRVLTVWLDASGATQDEWTVQGQVRLRSALNRWNLMRLPVRLTVAPSRAASDIRVEVISQFPFNRSDSSNATRAGVTHLSYTDGGEIIRAQVFIAENSPRGVRYSTADQEAILMHELGHAMGLPHSRDPLTLMAARPVVSGMTESDVGVARAIYANSGCNSRQAAAVARRSQERPRH